MNNILKRKVEQIKSSFSVEGSPLIKSDRFTQAELDKLRSESTSHSSHWYRHIAGARIWTDEEIAQQIQLFLDTTDIPESKFDKIIETILKDFPLEDRDREIVAARQRVYMVINWPDEPKVNPDFWAPFGSAPGRIASQKLETLHEKYGACSMEEIFDDQFSKKFYLFRSAVNTAISTISSKWNELKALKEAAVIEWNSPYNTMAELEESVTIKQGPNAARHFYLDKTKDFEQRVAVFNRHGEHCKWIHRPVDPDLEKIFSVYLEGDYITRYQEVLCESVIENWLDDLTQNRIKISYANKYHPKKIKTPRSRKPSKESVARLHRYYMEKLFLEGVSRFCLDW